MGSWAWGAVGHVSRGWVQALSLAVLQNVCTIKALMFCASVIGLRRGETQRCKKNWRRAQFLHT